MAASGQDLCTGGRGLSALDLTRGGFHPCSTALPRGAGPRGGANGKQNDDDDDSGGAGDDDDDGVKHRCF